MTRTPQQMLGASRARRSEDAPEMLLDGRYRLVRMLGEGGMGSVHLAEHVRLDTQVAVKFLHIELADHAEAIRRFEQEARIAASLRHNNIIQIFDVGCADDGEPFIVMEYLEGESLAGLLKRVGPMDLGATCGVIEPILLALQAAQRKGIIHRDLKPDNVFLAHQPEGPPLVKLIDFGLSKIGTSSQDQSRTQTGSVLGTPAYMSPEQGRGLATLDHRSDLYSLGIMTFEMLTGGLPYAGGQANEYFANLLTEEPRAPRDVYPSFPMAAEAFVDKAIRKNPDERFQSATAMLDPLPMLPGFADRAERLARISSGLGKSSFATGDLGASGAKTHEPRHSMRRGLVLGAVVAASLIIGVAAFGVYQWTSPSARAPSPRAAAVQAPVGGTEASREETIPQAANVAEPFRPASTLRAPTKPTGAATRKRAKPTDGHLLRGNRGIEMSERFE